MILFIRHWIEFFHVHCYLEPRIQHCKRFYRYNVVLRVLRQHWKEFFPVQFFWSLLLDNTAQGFYLCNVVSRVLRQDWTRFVPVCVPVFCLEPQGQYWIRFLPVQCCLKSINTTLKGIFSWAMFSGASWTTLAHG